MRKLIYLTLMLGLFMTSYACSTDEAKPEKDTPVKPGDTTQKPEENPGEGVKPDGKTLIVYYSYTNNVHSIVSDLSKQITADVVRVEPAEEGLDYAANNYEIGSRLIAAIRNNPTSVSSYPAIKKTECNLDDYGTVIIAAPLWWSNMAAPLQTFLFNYGSQMEGKSIGLIVSSASSGISGVKADAKRLVPGGKFFSKRLWIKSAQTSDCHRMLAEWLSEVGYK